MEVSYSHDPDTSTPDTYDDETYVQDLIYSFVVQLEAFEDLSKHSIKTRLWVARHRAELEVLQKHSLHLLDRGLARRCRPLVWPAPSNSYTCDYGGRIAQVALGCDLVLLTQPGAETERHGPGTLTTEQVFAWLTGGDLRLKEVALG